MTFCNDCLKISFLWFLGFFSPSLFFFIAVWFFSLFLLLVFPYFLHLFFFCQFSPTYFSILSLVFPSHTIHRQVALPISSCSILTHFPDLQLLPSPLVPRSEVHKERNADVCWTQADFLNISKTDSAFQWVIKWIWPCCTLIPWPLSE